jgi:hypothetical protein
MENFALKQQSLSIASIRSSIVDGLEMGILSDGRVYLTGRGLAAACGVSPGLILTLDAEWNPDNQKPRDSTIARLLRDYGYEEDVLFVKIREGTQEVNCHPEEVCMAILEYYAFEADIQSPSAARKNFRALARVGLRQFVYSALNYDPEQAFEASWRNFQDRLLLNPVPVNYFSVFVESSSLVMHAIRNGLIVDTHVVPDISIGMAWAAYWKNQDFSERYGERLEHPHAYPDTYAQSAANDKIKAWIYPLDALPIFKRWLRESYLTSAFPKYLKHKEKEGKLTEDKRREVLRVMELPATLPKISVD